ncbi:MAG TPA: lysylphosphatidylglycerol synthase domain-containing protein [Methylocystis sp.]|nr:lysylphosphatidylglycerol synthase domain-containing protein [Methylocystis sp.]
MSHRPETSGSPTGALTGRRIDLKSVGKWLGAALSLLLFAGAAFVLGRALAQARYAELFDAIRETPGAALLIALIFTCLSYLVLAGYDFSALEQIRARVPFRRVALASFTANAFSFTLGFPPITGAAVRFWIYKEAGLTARQVGNVTLLATLTFWLGMAGVFGAGLCLAAGSLVEVDHLPALAHFVLGACVLGSIGGYCLWIARDRRVLRLLGREMELPAPRTMLTQLALGMMDIGCAAAALYWLLPHEGHSLGYPAFLAVYVFAALLGAVSHAPGGVGVFDVAILGAVPAPSQESLLAALLLFRAIYFLLPFAVAIILLGAEKGFRQWNDALDTFRRLAERRGAS